MFIFINLALLLPLISDVPLVGLRSLRRRENRFVFGVLSSQELDIPSAFGVPVKGEELLALLLELLKYFELCEILL